MSDCAKLQQALAEAGFADLDNYGLVAFLCWFAEALRDAPLESFEAVNNRIGTANGLASGLVRRYMIELAVREYVEMLPGGGVQLTSRGEHAATPAGIAVD
jgi:hypothetical protein